MDTPPLLHPELLPLINSVELAPDLGDEVDGGATAAVPSGRVLVHGYAGLLLTIRECLCVCDGEELCLCTNSSVVGSLLK